MRKKLLFSFLIIALPLLYTITIYNQLPDLMASHWNINGQADGYIPKLWGILCIPLLAAVLIGLLQVLPSIDPKQNSKSLTNVYSLLSLILTAFLSYLYIITIIWNTNGHFPLIQWLIPAFGGLFFSVGYMFRNITQNWFLGIRTPWTLSSEIVWNKTHKQASSLYEIAGALTLFGIFLPTYAIFFIVAPVILISLYLVFYSYIEYKKEIEKDKLSY